jgi:hypothetical protein
MAKSALKSIELTSANVTDAGEYRDGGATLVVGSDISATRAQELIDQHRAIDANSPAETSDPAA